MKLHSLVTPKWLLILLTPFIFNIGCRKDIATADNQDNASPNINTAPKVFAGDDIRIHLPADSCILSGAASDAENNVVSYSWKKISGPSTYLIEKNDAMVSKVHNLQKGSYEFELSVTDKEGLNGKDTVKVHVYLAPVVFAGNDTTIKLHYVTLGGSYTAQNNIKKLEWKRISNVDCFIEKVNSLTTRITGLQLGINKFELTVIDALDYTGKDTVTVTVVQDVIVTSNSVIYSNLTWIFPWYNSLEAPNIYSYIPAGKPIKVFVQRDSSTTWFEAQSVDTFNPNSVYEYFIETRPNGGGMYNYGSLYVFYYGTDVSDNPHIKVEF